MALYPREYDVSLRLIAKCKGEGGGLATLPWRRTLEEIRALAVYLRPEEASGSQSV